MGKTKQHPMDKLSRFYSDALDWQIYRAGQVPGPGHYTPSAKLVAPTGGTFSKFTPASYLTQAIKRASQQPGPQDYPPPRAVEVTGGKFNMSNPKSELDWIAYRSSMVPGPADHAPPKLPGPSGGKFNLSNPKSDVDWMIYRAQGQPGPTDYPPTKLPKPSGGKFNMSKPKTDIEWAVHRAKSLPGPGDYTPPSDNIKKMSGGKFNLSNPKSDIDWVIYRAKSMPGPGSYDSSRGMQYLESGFKASMMSRPGPKSLPFPYGKAKNAPTPSYQRQGVAAGTESPVEKRGSPARGGSATPSRGTRGASTGARASPLQKDPRLKKSVSTKRAASVASSRPSDGEGSSFFATQQDDA